MSLHHHFLSLLLMLFSFKNFFFYKFNRLKYIFYLEEKNRFILNFENKNIISFKIKTFVSFIFKKIIIFISYFKTKTFDFHILENQLFQFLYFKK